MPGQQKRKPKGKAIKKFNLNTTDTSSAFKIKTTPIYLIYYRSTTGLATPKPAHILTKYLAESKPTIILTCPLIAPILSLISDMDTSTGPAKRSLRAEITRKYDQRVAETIERVDPNRAKARTLLKDVDDGTVTPLKARSWPLRRTPSPPRPPTWTPPC